MREGSNRRDQQIVGWRYLDFFFLRGWGNFLSEMIITFLDQLHFRGVGVLLLLVLNKGGISVFQGVLSPPDDTFGEV